MKRLLAGILSGAILWSGVSIARPITFGWTESSGAGSIPGLFYELQANGVSASNIQGNIYTLDVPNIDGNLLSARVRAATPDGRVSTWSELIGRMPDVPSNVYAIKQEQAPMASIWSDSATPAGNYTDTDSLTVGLRFRADVAGNVTGVRFYKNPLSTGQHIGQLWTNAGVSLGSVTFTGETASGWQTMAFASPIAIAANTTYVISVYMADRHYTATGGYFTSAGVDSGNLHALQTGVDGANGVYVYRAESTFPTETYNGANYWVDVVFDSGATIPQRLSLLGVGS